MREVVKRRGTKKSAKAISRSLGYRVSSVEIQGIMKFANTPPPPRVKLSLSRPWDQPRRRRRQQREKTMKVSPALLAAGFKPL